jgi:hypothetical protein
MIKLNTPMQRTNFSELQHDGTTEAAGGSRFEDDWDYTDQETFGRPQPRSRERRHQTAREAALRQASAMDDDELADIALHFGDR